MQHPALDQRADLAIMMNYVGSQIPLQWNALGIQLGLRQPDLDIIRPAAQLNVAEGMTNVFATWQRVDQNPTWRKLIRALRTRHINQMALAYNIQEYLTKPSCT